MQDIVHAVQWFVCLPASTVLAYFALEVALGLRPLDKPTDDPEAATTAILVPAHNEETVIGQTVRTLLASAPRSRVIVVADNCSDATAHEAATAGAEVIERFDDANIGKGHALEFGKAYLLHRAPDVVVIIDADCNLAPGRVERIASRAKMANCPVQALNLLTSPADMPPTVAVSNFAMVVKNKIRARGISRIGGSALLFGTGMAFPWPLFAQLPLASSEITEDIALSSHLASRGQRILLADDVLIESPPAAFGQSLYQRRRWEHGFLANITRQGFPILVRGVLTGSRLKIATGMHLIIPPIALLVLVGLVAFLVLLGSRWIGGSIWPLVIFMMSSTGAVLALLVSWVQEGRTILPPSRLIAIPRYIVWKIPLYLGFLTDRQKVWNRTERSFREDRPGD